MAACDQLRSCHYRHPGEGRDLTLSIYSTGEIPACTGMTDKVRSAIYLKTAIRLAVIPPP
jgi:hypothetical protein